MANYKKIGISDLDKLYKGSYSTILGAGGPIEEWIDGISDWMKENDLGEMSDIYVFKGSDVNKKYGLSGKNQFKNDLVILAWSNNKINMSKYAVKRLSMGIRWFDDIIDNSKPDMDESCSKLEEAIAKYKKLSESSSDKEKNFTFMMDTIKMFARSQGFYGRLLDALENADKDELEDLKNTLPTFKDKLDVVEYFES